MNPPSGFVKVDKQRAIQSALDKLDEVNGLLVAKCSPDTYTFVCPHLMYAYQLLLGELPKDNDD